MDSKWIESRKGILSALLAAIQGRSAVGVKFHELCGLRSLPHLLRMRVLDANIRKHFGGLGDLSSPVDQLAALDIPVSTVFIVENLQTGLAFNDLPGTVVLMKLGYDVDALQRFPWLAKARCFYWGDIDTHGFAILHRARAYLPQLESVLMDEATLLMNRESWVREEQPHPAEELSLLSFAELALYKALKSNRWGMQIRLEQEKIGWNTAWAALRQKAV